MALKIRLTRGGTKKRPYYRIVIAEAESPRDGRFIEKVGTYNPMLEKTNSERVRVQEDRVKYWLGVGAQPTDRVKRFLANLNIIDSANITEKTKKSQPKAKAQERLKEKAEKAAAAAQAAKESQETAAAD